MDGESRRVAFAPAARQDLADIRAYLGPRSPQGYASVVRAIERRILLARDNPPIGRPAVKEGVRELVEPRYGYVIPYVVHRNTILVLRIYRAVRAPLDPDTLEKP